MYVCVIINRLFFPFLLFSRFYYFVKPADILRKLVPV
nr:MAG TPA: hypothetical protein [Siphoviridae sp. ctYIp7]